MQTEEERTVRELFADVLGIEQIGVDDDFFVIGGYSLLATRLASRIRDIFAIDLPLKTIFERPTVSAIAALLTEANEVARQLDRMSADELEEWLRLEEEGQQQEEGAR
jgi:hypothetical protein